MKAGFFIAGTDTGVGKTVISAALVHAFAGQGHRVAGLKPIAAGCERSEAGLESEDVRMLRAASNVPLSAAIINPYAFEPPLAPHIAAAWAGERIELPRIVAAVQSAGKVADVVVVEGVGGFRVPLNDHEDTADLARMLALPVVLVVGMRLGCISHALLTVEAIQARGLQLAGWVANVIDPDMRALQENLEALQARIPARLIGEVPFMSELSVQAVAERMNCDRLLIH